MDENENNINNSKQIPLNKEAIRSLNLKEFECIEGIISNYKDPQINKIEKILNPNIDDQNLSLKEILKQKDFKFTQEYQFLNDLYTSLNCYIKIFKDYDRGCLTVSNNKIKVELNKQLIKLKKPTLSDISQSIIKNKSTQNELPNYLVNDTIERILTSKKIEKPKTIKPKYILDINLDLVTCKLIVHKEKQKCRLLLLGYLKYDNFRKTKVIKINCVNVEKSRFYHFCNVLNKSIILSEGYKNNKFGINFYKNYFTKSATSVLNFVREVNTGDILLFKNHAKKTSCQRKITKSEFNHISLIIKRDNNLLLYDCIEDDGIRLLKFIDCLKLEFNLSSEKIVYRKLNISIEDMINYIQEDNIDKYEDVDNYQIDKMSINEIKNKFYEIINQKVDNFINMNRNSKYEFSTCKYLCNSKKAYTQFDVTKRNKFFCSELIACIYMYCNIMEKKYDPSTYLPKDFTEKGKIEFINGFDFGEETIIDFTS